jgi:hypothetical protein
VLIAANGRSRPAFRLSDAAAAIESLVAGEKTAAKAWS